MHLPQGALSFLFITCMMFALAGGHPSSDKLKIRIHVPVKHHTHVHTKTVIKKVPLPIPVPVKEHHHEPKKHHSSRSHHHHHHHDDDQDDDFGATSTPSRPSGARGIPLSEFGHRPPNHIRRPLRPTQRGK
uniref:IP17783p n=1 Tax=Drosophila melanogaster TaxID=7227 RepID=A2VEK4_DROME|nr:IP17783p [Drosophila melanogaster]